MLTIDLFDRFIKGYVYFIQAGYMGPVKIGFTKNLKKRLRQLQTANPAELKILVSVYSNIDTEKSFHEIFDVFKIQGEWFAPVPKILEYVKELKKPIYQKYKEA